MVASSLEPIVRAMIAGHPRSYLYATAEASRQAVLSHLFLTHGNGWAWTEGQPAGEWLAPVETSKAYFNGEDWRITEPGEYRPGTPMPLYSLPLASRLVLRKRLAAPHDYPWHRLALYPYPARPADFPAVIASVWKSALIETLRWARDVYRQPDYEDLYMGEARAEGRPDTQRSFMIDGYTAALKRLGAEENDAPLLTD